MERLKDQKKPSSIHRSESTLPGSGECVFLALGSNLGDRKAYFEFAVSELKKAGFRLEKMSSFYETAPVGCEEGVPPFLNGVIQGVWQGSALELLDLCQSLEQRAGRKADHSSRQSRTLDLDLILFGDQVLTSPRLILPHPRAQIRQFVLKGLVQIAPDVYFPDSGKKASDLLHFLIEKEGVL